MATRQHGVVSRAQLVALGFGKDAIVDDVGRGRLHRLHPAVYAVGHRILGPDGRRMAATLSVRRSFLAFRSATSLWGMRPYSGTPELIVRGYGGVPRRDGVVVRRTINLAPEDVTIVRGIPVTTLARTILDACAVVTSGQERMILRAEQADLFDLVELHRVIERAPGHRGTASLLAALASLHPESAWTKSDLELAMLALCREYGLPVPKSNRIVEGFEVDFHWVADRVVGEADSWRFHKTRKAFQEDRRRDRVLQRAGYRVLRFTYDDVEHRPAAVADDLRAVLRGPATGSGGYVAP